MSRSEYEAKELAKLVGGEITHIIQTPEGEDEPFLGFSVFNKKTKKVYDVWIQQDAEGNGPGFLSIEEES